MVVTSAVVAAAVASSARADMVGTTLNTLNPASPIVVSDGSANGAAGGLLTNLVLNTTNSGVISGGTATFTESNPAFAPLSSGYFQARTAAGTVNLSAYSSGGIRFTYNADWAAASPTLQVRVRVNDGVSTWYSASVAVLPSATDFTVNWSQLLSGSSSLGDSLGRLSSVNTVELGATGFSSIVFSNLEVVPSPGAIALLGAAGLVGSRRRR